MNYNDNYLDITADAFSEMHVLIAGAIAIFENDTATWMPQELSVRAPASRMALTTSCTIAMSGSPSSTQASPRVQPSELQAFGRLSRPCGLPR